MTSLSDTLELPDNLVMGTAVNNYRWPSFVEIFFYMSSISRPVYSFDSETTKGAVESFIDDVRPYWSDDATKVVFWQINLCENWSEAEVRITIYIFKLTKYESACCTRITSQYAERSEGENIPLNPQ